MGWSAKLVTACVVGGALLGATYDGLGLIDRWRKLDDGPATDATETPTTMPEVQTETAPQIDPTPQVTVAEPTEVVTLPARDPLEVAMESRLLQELQTLGCTDVTLDGVSVSGQFTPAAEATSGFDSLYLTGNATLRAQTNTSLIALAGTGKGPGYQMRATDMAARGFARVLAGEEIGKSCDTLESE